MMKHFFTLLIIMSSSLAMAQTTVQGTVVDTDGQPIPNANVVMVGKAEGAVADFDGKFSFTTSMSAPFTLKASSLGYSAATITVDNAGDITIVMSENATSLDEIVISASRTPERIFESPVSVERFGLKQIQNASSESFYNSLQNLKGVDINTNSLTFQSINTRGFATFANTRFLQLVDGMDNTAPGLNFVLGNLVGMSELDVESVEILPGASSALYGAGAFNGILFMRSKSPFTSEGVSAYVKRGITTQEAAGTNDYYDWGVRFAKKFSDKLAIKANISVLKGQDWHANSTQDVSRGATAGSNRANNLAYDGLNVYGDEVATSLNFDLIAQGAGIPIPDGTLGAATISRTGYDERDLADYDAESVKRDFAVHYKPFGDDLELIYNYRRGTGTTIYQGANRYAVSGFSMTQQKFEIKNDNFFVRAYITAEDSGDAYDTRFAGININRRWKSDSDWFTQYAQTFIGASLQGLLSGGLLPNVPAAQAHAIARQVADTGRLVPGTEAFGQAFNAVKQDGNFNTGARFIDNTKFRHINGNYNLAHLINDWADIQVGGSYRQYELNSNGTIFTDKDGPIKYNEYGAYIQLQKSMADERLKLTTSARYDKNEFFDGFVSPRFSLAYTAGEDRNHNIRVSAQTGFRNPTTQDLFIGLDVGQAILVGSAPDNLDRDVRTFSTSAGAQLLGVPSQVQVSGRAAYENSFSLSSVLAGAPQKVDTDLIKPEEIEAFEVGYRGSFGAVTLDVSAYWNSYSNFVAGQTKVVPLYGRAFSGAPSSQEEFLAGAALQNGDYKVYQAYSNTDLPVKSYGVVAGLDARLGGFDLGFSYTLNELDFDEVGNDFRVGFNTARNRIKLSLGHEEIVKNVGFQVNYRQSDAYEWQASFADGEIPAYSVLDASVRYNLPAINSVFKIGGSNITGEEYINAIGSGAIGSIYYASFNINF